MPAHITRYDTMPIPPVPEQTEYLTAGPVTFGIEYRLLSAAIGAANVLQKAVGGDKGSATNDRGVSVHVFAREEGDPQECLRFDCFNEDPALPLHLVEGPFQRDAAPGPSCRWRLPGLGAGADQDPPPSNARAGRGAENGRGGRHGRDRSAYASSRRSGLQGAVPA